MIQPTILRKILARKLEEVAERSRRSSLDDLSVLVTEVPNCRGFIDALKNNLAAGRSAVIAEIKKASPSKGVIRKDFDPEAIARSYTDAGAACLSVLTDVDFFQGADEHLVRVRGACELPIIRKDFIVDEYQIYEARTLGADCILLIVAALEDDRLRTLNDCAASLGMDVLIEVHNSEELQRALPLGNTLVGINNRNLHNFETRLENTYQLLDDIPSDRVIVTESGIHSAEDVAAMRQHGVNAFLVGESLMRADDPGVQLKRLFF